MAQIKAGRLQSRGKSLILSYDFGLEHGPRFFTKQTVDPRFILDIALAGKFTGIILTPGVAHHYYKGEYKDIPLIVKLNAKSSLPQMSPVAKTICSVDYAVKLGATAVGYTIYDGSPTEPDQFSEFTSIAERAHEIGVPIIAWMYPRGPGIHDPLGDDIIAYSARMGMELGADFVKLKYNNHLESYKWIVQCAGATKVLVTEDVRMTDDNFLRWAHDIQQTGAAGIVVGKHVWGHARPFSIAKALAAIVFDGKHHTQVRHLLD
ncbi:MAG: fructose-bisphosphate aldolase [Nanoarchaeota archaeon]